MSRTSRAIVVDVLAAAAGALDGLAASGDQKAGRHWDTPGETLGGGPVISWGLAPLVQGSALGMGIGLQALGHNSGRGLTAAGAGMLGRAFAFKFAQHGRPAPVPTQG